MHKRIQDALDIIKGINQVADYKYWVGCKDSDAADEYLFERIMELAEMKPTNEEIAELQVVADPCDYWAVSRFMEEAREMVIHNEQC